MTDPLAPEDLEVAELRRRMLQAEDRAAAFERRAEDERQLHARLRSELEEVLSRRYP